MYKYKFQGSQRGGKASEDDSTHTTTYLGIPVDLLTTVTLPDAQKQT